jgi:hypothetical protein
MRKIFLPPELYMGIEYMDNETKWLLFDAIYRYNLWLEYKLDEKLKMIFWFFKPFFDNDIEKHKEFCESRKINGSKWWRPKASIAGSNNNPSKKPKKAKKPYKPTEMTWSEVNWLEYDILYNSNIDIVNKIKEKEKEKIKKEFPNKNYEVEVKKMCNNRAGKSKIIKKPIQALRNRMLPKDRDPEYIKWIENKTDDQWIKEFLSWKNDFNKKYWYDKYQEVKEKWINKCLSQPLSL